MSGNTLLKLLNPKYFPAKRLLCSLPKQEEKGQKAVANTQRREQENADPAKKTVAADGPIRPTSALTNFDKRLLVFVGRYKTIQEVPDSVSHETLGKARSKARIKVSNYLMVLTALGCIIYGYTGRKASERGESITKMNLDWHREMSEEATKKV